MRAERELRKMLLKLGGREDPCYIVVGGLVALLPVGVENRKCT